MSAGEMRGNKMKRFMATKESAEKWIISVRQVLNQNLMNCR